MMMNNLPDTPDLRILLIKLRHHGDMLLTTPVVDSLRQKWPQAQIDVLLYEETRDMLAAHPAIGTIYGIDRKWKQLGTLKHLQKEWQLLCALRNQHYHLVINLADQWRSAIVTRFTGAPVRLGFAFNKRNSAFGVFVTPIWSLSTATNPCIRSSRISPFWGHYLSRRSLPSPWPTPQKTGIMPVKD